MYALLVGVIVVLVTMWFVFRAETEGMELSIGRETPPRPWQSRYPGAVGYPIAGYPTWSGPGESCVGQLANCYTNTLNNPLCDIMYRSCRNQ